MAVRKPPITTREYWAPGHAACAGCGPAIVMKLATKAFSEAMEEKYGDPNAFAIAHATGCMEVVSAVFPYTAWKAPWIHVAFENAAAAASGVEAAWKKLGRKGKILAIGGDGGTADIGLQALSGMLERRHNVVYLMYDNEAYMNTGIQRSSSTPYGAWTTNTPGGKKHFLERKPKKKVIDIVIAHKPAYAATASVAYPEDFMRKLKKAKTIKGPSFIQLFAPCPTGWRSPTDKTIELARLAVQTAYFPLFEYENGKYKLNMPSPKKEPKPLEEYLKLQGRFKYMTKEDMEILQEWVLREWEELKKKAEIFG